MKEKKLNCRLFCQIRKHKIREYNVAQMSLSLIKDITNMSRSCGIFVHTFFLDHPISLRCWFCQIQLDLSITT